MRRAPQLSFLPSLKSLNTRLEHGGDIARGRRKLARPIDPRRPLHITLRSSRARGDWSLAIESRPAVIRSLAQKGARQFDVRIYQQANVGNHLHFLIKGRTRVGIQNFLRWLSGRIAMTVTRARKGRPSGRFWDQLLYSRVVSWGREFAAVSEYIEMNEQEAWGVWNRKTMGRLSRGSQTGKKRAPS